MAEGILLLPRPAGNESMKGWSPQRWLKATAVQYTTTRSVCTRWRWKQSRCAQSATLMARPTGRTPSAATQPLRYSVFPLQTRTTAESVRCHHDASVLEAGVPTGREQCCDSGSRRLAAAVLTCRL